MDTRRGLTRAELLVAVGVVTFVVLLVLLTATKSRPPYRQPAGVTCMANLKQWGLVFKLYADGHDGGFVSGGGDDNGKRWFEPFHAAYGDEEIWFCPTATKLYIEAGRNPFSAWKAGEVSGSYGLNGWIYNPQQGKTELWGRGPVENYWGNLRNLRRVNVNNVPILVDAMWFEGWPRHTDEPPPDENWPGSIVDPNAMKANQNEMRRLCVNRHMGHVNVLFVDWSVRRVGLKELWTLKWHRNYDVEGPWTKAGGVLPDDWPLWMKEFKDY